MNHEKAEANQQNLKKKGLVGCIEPTINQLVFSQVDIEKAGTVELRALLFPICHFIQRVAEKSI